MAPLAANRLCSFTLLVVVLAFPVWLAASTTPPYRSFQYQASPTCVALSPSGTVYAYYNRTQQVVSYFGNGSTATTQYMPFPVSALAVDAAGNLFVANELSSPAGLIQQLSPSGTVLASWGNNENLTIVSIAPDYSTGQLWATNSWSNLYLFDLSGGYPQLTINSDSYMPFPSAIVIDPNNFNMLWWFSGYNNQLYTLNTSTGYYIQQWYLLELPISGPTSIAVDILGLVYLADPNVPQVVKLNVSGEEATLVPWSPSPAPLLPQSLAVSSADSLWVADASLGRSLITRYDTNTGASLVNVSSPYPSLNGPDGLAMDATGTVHVLDALNDRVVAMQNNGSALSSLSLYDSIYVAPTGIVWSGLAVDTSDGDYVVGAGSASYYKAAVFNSSGQQQDVSFFGQFEAATTGILWQASPLPNVVVAMFPSVSRYWTNGSLATSIVPSTESSTGPQAIAVGSQGELLVLYPDLVPNPIIVLETVYGFEFQVVETSFVISAGAPSIAGSQSLTSDSLGQLYIAAPASNAILLFSSYGTWLDSWTTAVPPSLSAWALLIDPNGDLWAADGPNNRLVLFQQSGQPQLVQLLYMSNSTYPSVCITAVLSCSLVAGGRGALSCDSVLSGNHTYYPAISSPSVVTPLAARTASCRGNVGHILPLGSEGLVMGWGSSCSLLFAVSSGTAIAVDSVTGAASVSYAAVGSLFPASCPAPVPPADPLSSATVSFVYVAQTEGPIVCGAGSLTCLSYGANVYQCSSILSAAEFSYSPSQSPQLRSAQLSNSSNCTELSDGILPLTDLGLSFQGSSIDPTACSTLHVSSAGTLQLSTAPGETTFTYGVTTVIVTPQQACSAYIPSLLQSSSSSSSGTSSASSSAASSSSSSSLLPPPSGSSSSSSSPVPPPPAISKYGASLLSASSISFVAGQTASVQLTFQAPQNVLLVLLNSTGNVSIDDAFDPAALPAILPDDLQSTVAAYEALAQAQGLVSLYVVDGLGGLSSAQTIGALDVQYPPLDVLGYHRLLIVTGNGSVAVTDWVFVVPFVCTTWLRDDGSCAGYCPNGGFCVGDGRVWPEPSYWSVDEHSAPGACPLNVACPGALEVMPTVSSPSAIVLPDGSRDTRRCELGYTGVYCSECAPLYYHARSACRYCGSPDSARQAGVAIVAVVIVVLVGLMLALSSPLQLSTQVGVILTIQQLVTLGQTAGAALPSSAEWLQAIFQWVALINLDVAMFQPGCLIASLSFLDVFGVTIGIAAAALLLFTAAAAVRASLVLAFLSRGRIYGIGQVPIGAPEVIQPPHRTLASASNKELARWKADDQESLRARMDWLVRFNQKLVADASVAYHLGLSGIASWRLVFNARWQHAMVVWGALIYLRLTTASLQVLRCVHADVPSPTGGPTTTRQLLLADYTTVCWEGAHIGATFAALLILLVLSAGYPVLLVWFLSRLHSLRYLQDRCVELQIYSAKARSHRAADVANAPTATDSASRTAQAESLRQYLFRVYSSSASSNSSRATSDPASPRAMSPRTSDTAGDVELSTVSDRSKAKVATADDDDSVALQLVEAAVLDRLTSRQLTGKDAAHLDMAYLKPSGRMILAERDARYAYLLKGYRTDDARRVHLFPVVTFVLASVFACTVAFPSSIALTLLLSGLTFLAQGALVALLLPFVGQIANIKSVLASVAKLLQCLVALGLISALNTSVIHGQADAVHSESLQAQLASDTFRLFKHNEPYIIALCVLLLLPAALAVFGWRCRLYFQRREMSSLWDECEQHTDYSATASHFQPDPYVTAQPQHDGPYDPYGTDGTEPLPLDLSQGDTSSIDTVDHIEPPHTARPYIGYVGHVDTQPADPYAGTNSHQLANPYDAPDSDRPCDPYAEPTTDPYASDVEESKRQQPPPSDIASYGRAGQQSISVAVPPQAAYVPPVVPSRPSHPMLQVTLPVAPPLPQRPGHYPQ